MKPIFTLPQDSASVIFKLLPEYEEDDVTSFIQQRIEESDAILLDPGDSDEYEICIVRPEWEETASEDDKEQLARNYGENRDIFRWQYVDDSYKKKRMLDLNKYRWTETTLFQDYDANLVARRIIKWSDLPKKDEGTPPVIFQVDDLSSAVEIIEISSSDDDVEQPFASNTKEAPPKKRPGMSSNKQRDARTGGVKKSKAVYDDAKDLAILYFIDEFERHLYLGGYETFKVMASVQLFSEHTYESLHNRYRRYIRPELHLYKIDDEMRKRFLDAEIQRKSDTGKKHHQPPRFVKEVLPDWTPKSGVPPAGPSTRP